MVAGFGGAGWELQGCQGQVGGRAGRRAGARKQGPVGEDCKSRMMACEGCSRGSQGSSQAAARRDAIPHLLWCCCLALGGGLGRLVVVAILIRVLLLFAAGLLFLGSLLGRWCSLLGGGRLLIAALLLRALLLGAFLRTGRRREWAGAWWV
jgi:hypothetical protein